MIVTCNCGSVFSLSSTLQANDHSVIKCMVVRKIGKKSIEGVYRGDIHRVAHVQGVLRKSCCERGLAATHIAARKRTAFVDDAHLGTQSVQ